MSRVSTQGNYQSALLDLMASQQRSYDAQKRVTTQKNATDLIGFGRDAATVNALKSTQTKINTFIEVNKTVADRLESQDLAIGRVADAATASRLAIANAIAAGRMDGLMAEMEIQFQIASDGLNVKHQGQFLFSGGVTNTAPSVAGTLDALEALPDMDAAFANGQLRQASRLDDNVTMDTGFLAGELGTELFAVFRDLKALDTATPLSGQMDGATRDALTALMQRFQTSATKLVNEQGRNGIYASRIEKMIEGHESKAISAEIMLSNKTDADMAKAITELEMAQIALQASAQVINQLRQVSLLDYLR